MTAHTEKSPTGSDEFEKGVTGDRHDDGIIVGDTMPADPDAGLSDKERAAIDRKLIWRLDWILIPWLCFLYLIAFLDRTNIGNAKIAHLLEDLGMTTTQYNLTLTIFFIAYAIFEALANYLLKRFRPSIFLPISMAFWGASMVGMGFVHNFSGLMAARWFLGMTEAGLFPGVNYYLSCWYKRNELAVRLAIFFSAAALSGSFGGLLAAAIQGLDGRLGRPGWSWIFIIEGSLTIVVAIASFWLVHDFPDDAKFLSVDDRARVIRRLKLDNQSSADKEDFKLVYLKQALTDWKTYAAALIYMGPLMPLYSISLFLPTIVQNMGFAAKDNIVKNQLMSVPPYAVAAMATVVIGYYSDKHQRRGIYNMMLAPVGIVGLIMLIATTNAPVQYVGTFLATLGIYPPIAVIIAWIANNTEGVYKRGIVIGMVIGWGNLNGIVSSNIFFNGPRFYEGYGTAIGYMAIGLWGGSLLMWLMLRRENRLRASGARDQVVAGKSPYEIEQMGDLRPSFIYTT